MTKEQSSPREFELEGQVLRLKQENADLKETLELERRQWREEKERNRVGIQQTAREAVENSQLLLEAVLEQSPVPIAVVSAPDHVLRYLNQAATDFLGVSDEESYVGLTLAEVERRKTWRDADRGGGPVDVLKMPLPRALRGATTRNDEYSIVRKDGTQRWELVNGAPVYNRAGELSAGLIVFADITERKQAEEQFRQITNEQRIILNNIRMGISFVKNRKIQWVNAAFAKMYGYDANDLRGVDTSTFYANREDYERAESDGYPRLAAGEVFSGEAFMKRTDGGVFLCSITGQAVNSANLEEGSIWVLRDITEQRRTEELLRENEERFKRLVQNSNDIITVLDEKGVNVSINGPVEKILGYEREELVGVSPFDRIHPDDREITINAFSETVMQPGAIRRVEYRYRHKNGDWLALETMGANLLHDPVVKGIVLNTRDVSERNKLQEQLQQAMKMEAVGRLAGGVAHDFNNLLTIIAGNVELARFVLAPSDPLTQYLNEIYYAADSAASLTRQLLAFSRRQIIQPVVLNLNDLVRNLQKMLGRLLGEDIELQAILSEPLGCVKVDPGQFEQVLVNLSVNARDAMPDGGRLTIETKNLDFSDDDYAFYPQANKSKYVVLTVTDTGHGMSEEVKKHLFEPFFTTKPVGQGTGLGLATTFGAIKQVGGNIDVVSQPGAGATFKIYLPRVEKSTEKLGVGQRSSDLPRGSETILLVEDDMRVGKLALKALKRQGYKVLYAPNGGEAFMLIEKYRERIDLLMTDVVLPTINGRELAERLLKLHPEMKVLYTSGYTENIILHHGVVEKNYNFIGKPYSFHALTTKIRNILDAIETLGPGKKTS